MDRNMRFWGAGIALAGLGVLAGCGGGGVASVPINESFTTQMLVVEDSNLLTRDLSGGNPAVFATSVAAPYATVSSDGRTVAVPALNAEAHTYDVSFVDTVTGANHVEFTGLTPSSLAVSPDSMALAYCYTADNVSPQIKVVDRLTGTTTNWGPALPDMVVGSGLAWDPMNRYIAVPREQNNNLVLLSRGNFSAPIIVGPGVMPTFSANGSTLAYVTLDGKVGLFNVGSRTTRILNPTNQVETVSFARDGKSLLVTAIYKTGPGSSEARIASMSLTTGDLNFLSMPEAPQPQVLVGTIIK